MPITTAEQAIALLTDKRLITFPKEISIGFQRQTEEATFSKLAQDYRVIKHALGDDPGELRYHQDQSWLMEWYGSKNERLNFQHTENLRLLLKQQLDEIAKYSSGKQLLIKAANLLSQDGNLDVTQILQDRNNKAFWQFMESGPKASDAYDDQNDAIILNPWKKTTALDKDNNIRFFDITRPIIKGKITIGNEDMVEVGRGLSPMFLGWAHEIRHYTDKTLPSDDIYYDCNLKDRYYSGRKEGLVSTAMYYGSVLLGNGRPYARKEHMAVFDGNPNNTSELTLRMEAKEPLRYIYQTHSSVNEILVEPVKSVLKHSYAFIQDNSEKLKAAITVDRYLQQLPNIPSLPSRSDSKSYLTQNMKRRLKDLLPYFRNINVPPPAITDMKKSYTKTRQGLNFIDSKQEACLVDLLQTTSPSKVAYVYSRSNGNPAVFADKLKTLLNAKQGRNTYDLNSTKTIIPFVTPLLNMATQIEVNQKFATFLRNIDNLMGMNRDIQTTPIILNRTLRIPTNQRSLAQNPHMPVGPPRTITGTQIPKGYFRF